MFRLYLKQKVVGQSINFGNIMLWMYLMNVSCIFINIMRLWLSYGVICSFKSMVKFGGDSVHVADIVYIFNV